MKMYCAAVIVTIGSVSLIVKTCIFSDTVTRHAPISIAHFR